MSGSNTFALDRGWVVVLHDLGINVNHVLGRARLPVDLVAQDDARVTVEEYLRFWAALEEEAADPLLPINIGGSVSVETFHPAVFAAMCCPDFSVAVQRFAEYKRLIGPIRLMIEDTTAGLYVGVKWEHPTISIPASLAAMELVILTQVARIATRERISPVTVESSGEFIPTEAYTEFFGVEPKRGPIDGITFSEKDTRRPFLTASESLWQTFKPELQRRLTKLDASIPLTERLRSVLLECLPSGEVLVDDVTRRLGVSSRTLQRQLQKDGISYKSVVRDVREDLARHYVSNTTLAYSEIAFLLGFKEASSFFRAFREWTGETPESVRMSGSDSS